MDIIIGAIMVPPPPCVDGPSYAKEILGGLMIEEFKQLFVI